MAAQPSLWNCSPFGSPSHFATTVQVPPGATRKIRPKGMSVSQRLPARSKLGPSRKEGAVPSPRA
jgi:hypothetical protein